MTKGTLVALILWPVCALLLLPLIWMAAAYDYQLKDYLSLLWFPGQPSENGLWLGRILLLGTFVTTTVVLVIAAIRKVRRTHN